MMSLKPRCGQAVLVFVCLMLSAPHLEARPETIRAGMKYYSDEYFEEGLVRDIESEKNYEEIWQHYTYYEVVYDSEGRVTVFKEYKQGKVIYEAQYRYGSDDNDVERTVLIPGRSPEVTRSKDLE